MKHGKTALLAGAVTFVFLITACSQAVFQTDAPAYPTFSLVGAPDRDVTYELRVTGPGVTPFSATGIGPTSGSVTLSVPAGRNRTFELIAENDVYTGSTTADLAGGRESRITIPLLPGPVFYNRNGVSEAGQSFVQIRDFNATLETGSVLSFTPSLFNFSDATQILYTSDGKAVVAEVEGIESTSITFYVYSDIGTGATPDFASLAASSSAEPNFVGIATHPTRNSVLFSEVTGNDGGPIVTISEMNLVAAATPTPFDSITIPENSFTNLSSFSPDFRVEAMAIDANNNAWIAVSGDADEIVNDLATMEIILVGVDLDTQTIIATATQSIVTGVSFRSYDNRPILPPRVGLHVSGNNVYMILSGTRSTHPAVFGYAIDTGVVTEWGTTTTSNEPAPGEFWGPRQFVATRRDNELIVIDQQDNPPSDSNLNGSGRLVRFQFGTTEGWQTFGESDFGFFDTSSGS